VSDPAALLALAASAARAAGNLLLDRFGGTQSGLASKSTRTDLVSDADRDAEALITGMLRAARPDDALLAEEGGAEEGASGVRWLVDPLDGTVNYLWGVPHWSVSIAARDGAGDLAAVVHDPCRDETFTAVRGGPARRGDDALTLSPSSDVAEALLGTGFAYAADERARQAATLEALLPRVRDIRRFGSAALDLAWVAAGRLDAFYETGLSDWDWAAGAMLVREAGGTVHRLVRDGRPPGILAARPGLHAPIAALIDTVGG
jgi:myo-inositol-1(or 4)-monophosphatase